MNVVPDCAAHHHIGIAWNWAYDADFVQLLDRACHQAGLNAFLIGPHNLAATFDDVAAGRRQFDWFLDRASDEDRQFLALNHVLQTHGTRFLNAHHHYLRASDKAEIHRDLVAAGLHLPLTLILPPHERVPEVDPAVIESFAKPFVIKPARGGGGHGVMVGATRYEDVVKTRAVQGSQRYLIQQCIDPQLLGDRRAWFRVYYICGSVLACWWDDRTHRYAVFGPNDSSLLNVAELERIVRKVAVVAELDFFSTEIALDKHGRYVVIDYVNTPCDMRLQSRHQNGPPDAIVHQIVTAIIGYVKQQLALASA